MSRIRSFRSMYLYGIALIVLSGLSLPLMNAQVEKPQISGRVRAADGSRAQGAVLRYTRIQESLPAPDAAGLNLMRSKPVLDQPYVDSRVALPESGEVAVTDLPAGVYLVCVEFPDRTFLDTCKWSHAVSVDLKEPGKSLEPVDILVARAAEVRIRVNDPQQLMPDQRDPFVAPNLIVGVKTKDGDFHGAEQISKDETGRDYRLVVPVDVPLYLWVFSRHYKVLDEPSDLPLDRAGAMVPFRAVSATAGVDFALTIAGSVDTYRPF